MILKFNKYKLNENPDILIHKGLKIKWSFGYSFGYSQYNDRFLISKSHYDTHGDLGGSRKKLDFPGRIWPDEKLISFWKYPTPKKLLEIIKLSENILKIDIDVDEWEIEIPISKDGEIKQVYDWMLVDDGTEIIFAPVKDYSKYYNKMNKTNIGIDKAHIMSPIEKEEKNIKKIKGIGSDKTAWDSKNNLKWRQAKMKSEKMKNLKTYEEMSSKDDGDDVDESLESLKSRINVYFDDNNIDGIYALLLILKDKDPETYEKYKKKYDELK